MDFFGIGGWEILLILVVILIVAGPGKLPEIARSIGRTIRAIKRASSGVTTAVSRELDAVQQEKEPGAPPTESRAQTPPGGRSRKR